MGLMWLGAGSDGWPSGYRSLNYTASTFFWLIIGLIFHAVSETSAWRWRRRMATADAHLVRDFFSHYVSWGLSATLTHAVSGTKERTVLAESIQSNR